MAGDLNSRKESCKWIVVSLLSLLSINIKYLYLTPSSTSQITILLDEWKVEELTGWLTVNNGEIVRVDKPHKKNSTPSKFFFSRNHIYNRIINWYCTIICNVFSNNCSICNSESDPSGILILCLSVKHKNALSPFPMIRNLQSLCLYIARLRV